MAGRPNWHSEHPPACTCARCNEGRRRRRDLHPVWDSALDDYEPPPNPPRKRRRGFVFGFFITLGLAIAVAVIGFVIYDSGILDRRTSPPSMAITWPTPTSAPTSAPTVAPTETPIPAETPTETPTSTPSPMATPTATPAPMATAMATPAPTVTPSPTITPTPPTEPTAMLEPTATSEPEDTPEPTAAPIPTATPKPPAGPGLAAFYPYRNGRYIVQSRRGLAESILETSWIEDGIADSEKDAIQEIVDMAAFHDGITKSVLALDWYEDGVSETELRAIRYLDAIAGDDEPAAEIVASLAWFVDGVSESDVYAMRNIRLISQDDGASARRIVAMPFISTLEPADIAAIRSLSSMAYFQSRGFEYVMARDSLSDGITDAQSPIVAMLYGVYKINPGLMDTLLDPNLTTIERRMISLPLTGSVDLVIVRTRPGAARSMDLLEYAARTSEELMGEPLPTNFVGLLFEDAVSGGFAGTNFGTHITIRSKV